MSNMIDVDEITDYIFERVSHILNRLGHYVIDDEIASQIVYQKKFTLHNTGQQQIPLCKVSSFISQFHETLLEHSNINKSFFSFQVEGPVEISDTCFLNKQPHSHQIWQLNIS
jgi:hypothetical protein